MHPSERIYFKRKRLLFPIELVLLFKDRVWHSCRIDERKKGWMVERKEGSKDEQMKG